MTRLKPARSSLFLIELIIAILFFSAGSAVCVRAFAQAHRMVLRKPFPSIFREPRLSAPTASLAPPALMTLLPSRTDRPAPSIMTAAGSPVPVRKLLIRF